MDDSLTAFDETTSTEAFTLQNAKLLKVSLRGVTVQAKLGSMVAYQGDVSFEHAGAGGLSRFVKKAVTGEGQSLMKVSARKTSPVPDTFISDWPSPVIAFLTKRLTPPEPACSKLTWPW